MVFEAAYGGTSPAGQSPAGFAAFKRSGSGWLPLARGSSTSSRSSLSEQRAVACNAGVTRRRGAFHGDDGEEARGMPGDLQRRRAAVIQYVRETQPGEVQAFIEEAPPTVVAAMKQTVSNMVGTLPPQNFAVTITTVAESLASLMQTMLRTGYLLRGVQYQLELELALQSAAASMMGHATQAPPQQQQQPAQEVAPPSPSSSVSTASAGALLSSGLSATSTMSGGALIPEVLGAPSGAGASGGNGSQGEGAAAAALGVRGWSEPEDQYAPGVQLSRIDGDVLRWHMTHGLERMPATQYIRVLEQKVAELQQQVQQQQQQVAQQQAAQQQAYGASASGFQPFPPLFTSTAAAAPGAAAAGAVGGASAVAAVAAAAGGMVDSLGGGGAANPVLAYLRSLDSSSLAALGACGPDVSDAMTLFVARLMGTTEHEQLRQMTSEFTAVELSKLLFWLLVVGWSLRAMEVRLEVEEGFGSA